MKNLKAKALTFDPKELDLFFKAEKKIFEEQFEIFQPYLTAEFKRFHVDKYGKEIDGRILGSAIKQTVSKFGHLTLSDVKYVLDAIIRGEYDETVYKFSKKDQYNTSDIIKCLNNFSARRNTLKSELLSFRRDQHDKESGQSKALKFLQNALEKISKKELLTVYERSAVGKHYASQLTHEERVELMREAENNLVQMQKELSKRKSVGMMVFFRENHEMQVPIAWTTSLLYGVTVFNYVNSKDEKVDK